MHYRWWVVLASIAGVVVIAWFILGSAGNNLIGPGRASGIITGTITLAPTCPVARVGEACAVPASHQALDFTNLKSNSQTTTQADSNGRYGLSLPAGNYRITAPDLTSPRRLTGAPAQVTISADSTTQLDLTIDTGIR